MDNDLRGSATITIDGEDYEVGQSIGALARLAKAFGVKTFDDVNRRVNEMNLEDMPVVLQCLLRGNGHKVSDEAIERLAPGSYFAMLRMLYDSAFPASKPNGAAEGATANPPQTSLSS
jgi:hypothetical protein